jgi:hypothetical protein
VVGISIAGNVSRIRLEILLVVAVTGSECSLMGCVLIVLLRRNRYVPSDISRARTHAREEMNDSPSSVKLKISRILAI